MTAARLPLLTVAALARLVALPGAALACSPTLNTPSDRFVTGEACAMSRHVDAIRTVGLSPARDIGHGIVVQDIFDGNACYWEANLIVFDCAAGTAAIIGPDNRALMDEPRRTGIDKITDRIAAGAQSLDAIAARAATEGYDAAPLLHVGARINVNGISMPTDCACALFYAAQGNNKTAGRPQ